MAPLGATQPPPDGAHRALLGAATQPAHDANRTHRSVATHDDLEQHCALDSATTPLVGVRRLHFAHECRRLDAGARPVRATACAAARSVTEAVALTLAESRACSTSNSA